LRLFRLVRHSILTLRGARADRGDLGLAELLLAEEVPKVRTEPDRGEEYRCYSKQAGAEARDPEDRDGNPPELDDPEPKRPADR